MIRTISAAFILVALMAVGSLAMENRGAEKISLDGGSRGNISFPHALHQDRLGDCEVCHKLFPKEKGSIEKLKSEGRLAKKQIMNTLCIKCHNAKAREGQPSGPRVCSKCHVRE